MMSGMVFLTHSIFLEEKFTYWTFLLTVITTVLITMNDYQFELVLHDTNV